MAFAIWSTHVLTAATASSSVMSTYEPARAAQVTEQQEVDDVAGPVVDRRRRVMRIGACMELLCDLEPQGQRREGVRAGTRVETVTVLHLWITCRGFSSRKERKHVRLDRIGTH